MIMELRVAAPLLDVRLFARRGFGAGSLSVTIQFLVTFGVFLLLVQYLQLILGYGPLGSALGLVPALSASVTVLLSTVSLWLGWWPPRLVTAIAAGLAAGYSAMSLSRPAWPAVALPSRLAIK